MSVVVPINTSVNVKLGDNGYAINFTLYTDNGDGTYTIKDLSSVTSATLKVYRRGASASVLLTKALTILNPASNGVVQWTLAASDTTTLGAGSFQAEIQLTASGYQESTQDPFQLQVTDAP
jgi:hypothetical protein